jgi:radical SAM protein with 4Fe4S-binding SPASM domain
MGSKPKLGSELFYAEKGGKHLFLHPHIPNWMVVNSNAAFLLSRCDGERTVSQIAASCDALTSDVELLFRQAAERGLISDCACSDGGKFGCARCSEPESREPAFERATSLRIVHYKLTDNCNLRCRYCYAESGKDSGHLSFNELSRIAREVAEIAPSVECVLSGGEPMLHPDLFRFSELLRSMGNQISLLTNGTLINRTNIDRIVALATRIKISLDGSTEAIHSLTRGKKSYATIVQAIDMLIEHGANVQVAMTVHKENSDDIDAMTRRYGSHLTFQPLFMAGRDSERHHLALTGREYYEALASTENVAPMASIGTLLEGLRGRGVKRCALAEAEISISENGDVYPCQMLEAPEFLAGNLRETPLKEIYFNSPALKKARAISVDTLEKCKECPIRLLCAGACRARDFHSIGTIESVDEFCEYEQMAYLHGLFDSAEL